MEQGSKQDQSIWDSNPKITFALGFIAGVAIITTVGLVMVLNFLMSGKSFGAMASATDNALAQGDTYEPPADLDGVQQAPQDPRPVDAGRDHIWGKDDASVTLIVYSDFECPYCGRHYETVNQIKEQYPNDVRIVFRHFPLSFHANAQKASEASECAADQGKFWEMHDKIFEANLAGSMSVDAWKTAAKDFGMDTAKFNNCLDNGEKAARVAEDLDEGQMAGVEGTPATFINGQLISGAMPFESFKTAIDTALQQ